MTTSSTKENNMDAALKIDYAAQESRYFASGEELSVEQAQALIWLIDYKGSFAFLLDVRAQLLADRPLSEKQVDAIVRSKARDEAKLADEADRLLDQFYAADVKPLPRFEPVASAGFFEFEGSIVKVQVAVHGSGNLYAKRLIVDEGSKSGTFVYEAGLVRKLRESDRLTKERAVELGQLYGMCMICGATLTDETSIERGIGPVCFGKL